jgi:hypothetical protein
VKVLLVPCGRICSTIGLRRIYLLIRKGLLRGICTSLKTQLGYTGTDTGEVVDSAYAFVMRMVVVCGVCFVPLCIGCIFLWTDVDVKKEDEERRQMKRNVS